MRRSEATGKGEDLVFIIKYKSKFKYDNKVSKLWARPINIFNKKVKKDEKLIFLRLVFLLKKPLEILIQQFLF